MIVLITNNQYQKMDKQKLLSQKYKIYIGKKKLKSNSNLWMLVLCFLYYSLLPCLNI